MQQVSANQNQALQSKFRMLDIWYLAAVIGYIAMVARIAWLIATGNETASTSNVEVALFLVFLSFNIYLTNRVAPLRQNAALWLVFQPLLAVGFFVFYYPAVYRRRGLRG